MQEKPPRHKSTNERPWLPNPAGLLDRTLSTSSRGLPHTRDSLTLHLLPLTHGSSCNPLPKQLQHGKTIGHHISPIYSPIALYPSCFIIAFSPLICPSYRIACWPKKEIYLSPNKTGRVVSPPPPAVTIRPIPLALPLPLRPPVGAFSTSRRLLLALLRHPAYLDSENILLDLPALNASGIYHETARIAYCILANYR